MVILVTGSILICMAMFFIISVLLNNIKTIEDLRVRVIKLEIDSELEEILRSGDN